MDNILMEWREHERGFQSLWVTINRPKALNAINSSVIRELVQVMDEALEKTSQTPVVAMFLTGSGEKAFVAGADISEMSSMDRAGAENFSKSVAILSEKMEKAPFPIVALVNGFALGGGCELAMCCDLVFADKKAVFGQPEVKLGLIPGFGGTQRLVRRVGPGRALDLITSGRHLNAEKAYELGLVDRLVEESGLKTEAEQYLRDLLGNSPLAVARSKQAVLFFEHEDLHKGLENERELFSSIFESADAKEGMDAFMNKRKPEFLGK